MKRRFLLPVFFLSLFLLAAVGLFASGKKEETAGKPPINSEWVLCITSPDVSDLPVERQITGNMAVNNLAGALRNVSFRKRGDEEAAYYEDYAWVTSRAAAAKALAAKRSERDLLIYKGDKNWKYRKNLKTVDEAILKLEDDLALIDSVSPAVERRPLFRLVDVNNKGTFPPPPAKGDEYRFCTNQKADAFLVSSLSEYHGRIYFSLKMYTLFTRSFSYEDSVLFSSDDLSAALNEVSGRLAAAIAETLQSGLIVHAAPEDVNVAIDGSFAAKGEMYSYSPGTVNVEVYGDNYQGVSLPVELKSGEISELFIDLTPVGMAAFNINVPGRPGSKVFLGSRYAGETPLSLELPKAEYVYISVETPEGEIGSMVYRDSSYVKGSAQFMRTDAGVSADFITKMPVSPEEKKVEKARRGFYWAYGAFWLILPAASLTANYAKTYMGTKDYYPVWSGVRIGANAVWGSALAVTLFQMVRYLYHSGGDSTPLVRVPEPEAKQ